MLLNKRSWLLLSFVLSTTAAAYAEDAPATSTNAAPGSEVKPFQLGIEQKDFLNPTPPPPPPNYGTPQMVPENGRYAQGPPLNGNVNQGGPLNGNVNGGPGGQMQPMQPQNGMMPPQQQGPPNVLPPAFMGRWQVMGSRSKANAMPQFQSAINTVFSMNTQNIWIIQGNPQSGYSLSNDQGIQTQLMVQMQGAAAVLRYQHPIKNTMAQEAVVMQLMPGGAQFQGLERISIVKEGEGVRAQVEYTLVGHRQQ